MLILTDFCFLFCWFLLLVFGFASIFNVSHKYERKREKILLLAWSEKIPAKQIYFSVRFLFLQTFNKLRALYTSQPAKDCSTIPSSSPSDKYSNYFEKIRIRMQAREEYPAVAEEKNCQIYGDPVPPPPTLPPHFQLFKLYSK